jgi:hypothetical protein
VSPSKHLGGCTVASGQDGSRLFLSIFLSSSPSLYRLLPRAHDHKQPRRHRWCASPLEAVSSPSVEEERERERRRHAGAAQVRGGDGRDNGGVRCCFSCAVVELVVLAAVRVPRRTLPPRHPCPEAATARARAAQAEKELDDFISADAALGRSPQQPRIGAATPWTSATGRGHPSTTSSSDHGAVQASGHGAIQAADQVAPAMASAASAPPARAPVVSAPPAWVPTASAPPAQLPAAQPRPPRRWLKRPPRRQPGCCSLSPLARASFAPPAQAPAASAPLALAPFEPPACARRERSARGGLGTGERGEANGQQKRPNGIEYRVISMRSSLLRVISSLFLF